MMTPGQIKRLLNPKIKCNWSADDISNGVAIHAAGPRAYRLMLRKNYPLPGVTTLQNWCSKVALTPGLINHILQIMAASDDLTVAEKLCVLSFDEMKITKKHVYSQKFDETLKPANYVQVVVIRGLVSKWKQVIYFNYDCNMTKALLDEIVRKVCKT